ncbi:MAG: hypothetical protein LBQ59_00165 [Candidatus Peribacteria bacterium]|nr:hypothetical protein [Candidatus Peribacteria bacterium]
MPEEEQQDTSVPQTTSPSQDEIREEQVSAEPKLETKEELDEFTKLELDDDEETEIPDWLR